MSRRPARPGARAPDLVDPDDFPFTEEEVHRAERLLSDEASARAEAAQIARAGREARASRLAADVARAHGRRGPTVVDPEVLYLSPVLFAPLAALSPELEARVEAYRSASRAASRAPNEPPPRTGAPGPSPVGPPHTIAP